MEELEKITIEKNGERLECDVLFTFDSEDTNKAYIGYTDNKLASNGRKNIYISSFDPILGTGTLEDVETDEEWDMIKDVLKEIEESIER